MNTELREKRKGLVRAAREAGDEMMDARDRAFGRGTGMGGAQAASLKAEATHQAVLGCAGGQQEGESREGWGDRG